MRYSLFILVIILTNSCKPNLPGDTKLSGALLPSFKIRLIDSTSVIDIREVEMGKPLVLFVFDPDCPFCRKQLEGIIEDKRILKDAKVIMITIAPFRLMKSFYRQYEIGKYENIIVAKDIKNYTVTFFNLTGVPFIAIYSDNYKLLRTFNGKVDADIIYRSIHD